MEIYVFFKTIKLSKNNFQFLTFLEQENESKALDTMNKTAYYTMDHLTPVLLKPPVDRDAPGEFGHSFEIPKRMGPSYERQIEEGYKRYAFNVLVSDIISVHRNLGDKREDECKVNRITRDLHECVSGHFLRNFSTGTNI